MQTRHQNRWLYFQELANTSHDFYIPYLKSYGIEIKKGIKVLEVGCGEGGNLLPFSGNGCSTLGIDQAETRIKQAKTFFQEIGNSGAFITADFFNWKSPNNELFDIILVHDVIEHIERKEEFITKIKSLIKVDGCVFFGFPAWQMPFGGHQQICKNKVCSLLPFIHLLPSGLYVLILKAFGEDKGTIKELCSIKQCGTSTEHFEKIISKVGFHIINRKLWFINPHYKQKFNLKPVKLLDLIASVPYLRDFLSSSCFYLIKKTI
ncbi:class I SAM-dependent methyltransferase [Phocaeicola sp.]